MSFDLAAYKAMVMEPAYADRIGEAIARKEAELLITQTGKPAPSFTLSAIDGKTYSLSDFAGKVVYIDLWASWCHPCRQEVPDYRKLYAKYKDDSRIVFIVNSGELDPCIPDHVDPLLGINEEQ